MKKIDILQHRISAVRDDLICSKPISMKIRTLVNLCYLVPKTVITFSMQSAACFYIPLLYTLLYSTLVVARVYVNAVFRRCITSKY